MEKQNTSLFTRLKLYYNKKPVRVIIALIIIAGIMTGVAFGVIALVRALKDPCANEPGKTWNEDAKMCVDVNCKNVCNKDGTCLDNYCNYSTSEGKYQLDSENCACYLDCSNGESINTNDPNISYTKMKKENEDDPNSKLIPIDPLICGETCKYDKHNRPEGKSIGFCEWNQECKVMITPTNNKDKYEFAYQGCKPGNEFDRDWSWEECSDTRVVCGGDKPGQYECVNNQKINVNGDTFNSYCKPLFTCGKHDDNKVICTSNNDCIDQSSSEGECQKVSSEGTIQPNHVSGLEIFQKRGIKKIGICNNSKNILDTVDNYCVDINLVGENNCTTTNCKLNRLYYPVPVEEGKKGYVGISFNQPQCKNIYNTNPQCLSSDLEKIPWFCDVNGSGCNYINSLGKLISCPESAPEPDNSNIEPTCCNINNYYHDENIQFCCPSKLQSTVTNSQGECLNISEYKPDPKWLGLSSNENLSCNEDKDCYGHTEKLYSALEKTKTSGTESPNNNPKSKYYANLFCNKSQKECNFFAGYIDKVSSKEGGSTIDGKNAYVMGNNLDYKVSHASYASGGPMFDTNPYYETAGDSNIMLCGDGRLSPDNPLIFGKYYSTGEPQPKEKVSQYTASGSLNYSYTGSFNESDGIINCLKYASDRKGLYSTDWTANKVSEGENTFSINYGSVTASSETSSSGECQFNVNCNAAVSDVKISETEDGKPITVGLKWNFGSENFPKIGVYESGKSISDKTRIKIMEELDHSQIEKVKPPAFELGGCAAVTHEQLSAANISCEELSKIPSKWNDPNQKNNFAPLCITNPNWSQKGGSICINNINPPKLRLDTGTWCDNGFTFDGNHLSAATPEQNIQCKTKSS